MLLLGITWELNWSFLGTQGATVKRCTKKVEIRRRSLLIKREMGLMQYRMCFSKRKSGSHGCRVWHCPSFTTVPKSPVSPYADPPSWFMLPSQTLLHSLKTEKKKSIMMQIKCRFKARLRSQLSFSHQRVWQRVLGHDGMMVEVGQEHMLQLRSAWTKQFSQLSSKLSACMLEYKSGVF